MPNTRCSAKPCRNATAENGGKRQGRRGPRQGEGPRHAGERAAPSRGPDGETAAAIWRTSVRRLCATLPLLVFLLAYTSAARSQECEETPEGRICRVQQPIA